MSGTDDLLKFAESTAAEAGRFLRERLNSKHSVDYKGEINIVTEEDRMSEEIIKSEIRKRCPGHGILAEETPETGRGAEFRWIIDPLDGTTNYAHGYPVFCVSLALEKNSSVLLGVIYNPMLEEMFTARAGGGAFLNGKRICVSSVADLSRSLLATGFPYDIRTDRFNNLDYFAAMAVKAQAIRRAGSAALDLAYTACGRFDGFWELKLKPWDTAAGCLLLAEAGGKITDLDGNEHRMDSAHIVASNGMIHDQMLRALGETEGSRRPRTSDF
ncbi:MAG: inositol monophosphatase family protein [Syntrophales bacterium]|nr:inositol monophosphatase family protein [Syntrophales bacterium]MDD5232030.1 inositol monophosphatase family protein [Syntrophales bacterium]MDD5533030.1 inositol monophosphatase family protein [Syntrophales bacterium]HPL63520.1 inositol monophosphatase family protein [Syntrophales bacterium]